MADNIHRRTDRLEEGWADLRAGRWQEANSFFAGAVAQEASPEAFEGLSWAAWWLDDEAVLFEAREQAFRLYRERGDAASAARMASWLAADQLDFHGAVAVASGWLDRARRLLDSVDPGPDHGWLAFHRGFIELVRGQTDEAERDAVLAARLGREFGVSDLEMLGLALQGTTLVSRARIQDGMRCLDEASAIALAGEATIPISSAWTCCFLVTACTKVLDFERAFEWCDQIADFAERYGSRYMLGFCRAEYATVHLWRGEWAEAEKSLEESVEALSESRASMAAWPLVTLAELRRRQGQAEESHRLLDRAGPSAGAQLCRASLALDRGDARHAIDLVERVVRGVPADRPLERMPALELLARAQIAHGELDAAAAILEKLRDVAKAVGTTGLESRTVLLEGMVAAAAGDHQRAKPLLEDAIDGFERCRAPFDAARARIELASTLVSLGLTADAEREARAAHDRLQELGAVVDKERARRLTQKGDPERARPVGVTRRERDVLVLLAEGLTNRQISKRLFISEHTVHRHVTSILRKLDVPSRAAAAAYAVRAGLVESPRE